MKKNLQLFRQLLFTLLVLILTVSILPAQVAINSDGSTPDNSAMLDVKSTNKGLLIPRLTTAARNTLAATAVAGLMVYDTDLNKFYFYNGVTWDEGSTGSLWSRNASDTYLTNSSDDIGIGTSTPAFDIDINRTSGNAFLRVKSTASYAGMFIDKPESTSNGYVVYRTNGADKWFVGLINDNNFAISRDFAAADGTFYIDSTSGNVGIGTILPARVLDVHGGSATARLSSSTSGARLEFLSTATTDWAVGTWGSTIRFLSSTNDFGNVTDEYSMDETVFKPWSTNTKALGTSSVRWSNLYSVAGDFSGDVSVNRLTAPLTIYDGASDSATVQITPMTTGSGHNSSLLLAEDDDGTYGMIWNYDGGRNDLELFGKSGTTRYGPHMIIDRDNGNIAFGSTFATGYKLSVDGKIMCEELRVDLSGGWPDYVFGEDYQLMSIKELDSFIEANGHLPNIPAAEEIQESGLEVGEMQRLMMEKIEELSLYIIKQQKEIDELKIQINKNQE